MERVVLAQRTEAPLFHYPPQSLDIHVGVEEPDRSLSDCWPLKALVNFRFPLGWWLIENRYNRIVDAPHRHVQARMIVRTEARSAGCTRKPTRVGLSWISAERSDMKACLFLGTSSNVQPQRDPSTRLGI